jgi:hypothetical protein
VSRDPPAISSNAPNERRQTHRHLEQNAERLLKSFHGVKKPFSTSHPDFLPPEFFASIPGCLRRDRGEELGEGRTKRPGGHAERLNRYASLSRPCQEQPLLALALNATHHLDEGNLSSESEDGLSKPRRLSSSYPAQARLFSFKAPRSKDTLEVHGQGAFVSI